jgi:NAD(P)-dependent dehydrogenase (short-subunit alcohol dehydrogenase family)
MDLDIAGQTAVVIGAARGIGHAIATGFAAEGARVALLDCDPDVKLAAEQIEKQRGVRCLSWIADVVQFDELQRAAEEIEATFERLDHVVFAVAIGSGKFGFPFWNLGPADWERVLQVNVLGAVNVAHVFTPALVRARSGTLLFLASVAGQIGSQTDPPYSASKAALINFAQCTAKDLAPYGIRVNTLCPGMVKTTLNRSVWEAAQRLQSPEKRQPYDEWAAEKIGRVTPLGRWQEPEDMAAMAVFLASPRARNVTGQTINVDGGQVMHW